MTHLVVIAASLAALSVLWRQFGKPWCDCVSGAQRYPRLTRISLVAFLYVSAISALGVLAYIADTIQHR